MKLMKHIGIGLALVVFGMCGAVHAGESKVGEMSGEAFIANKDGIHRAKTGMALEAGDMVMTREGAYLDMILNGKAGCRLLPGTTSAIAKADDNDVKILVAEGNIVLNIKPLDAGSNFTVDTPTAVAAVRGTQFWGRVAGTQNDTLTTFAVKEGAVRVTTKDDGKTVDLQVGQAADLAEGVDGPQVRAAEPGEMAAMQVADQIKVE